MFDLLIRNAYVIDPVTDIEGYYNIAIEDGKIAGIYSKEENPGSKEELDATGLYLCPGLIDMHVHVTRKFAGPHGYKMIAKSGVTTAIDFAGPIEEILQDIQSYGCGLNVGCCNAVIPEGTVETNNPTIYKLKDFISNSLSKGALGIKLLGGHFPLTPEATRNTIDICNKKHVFVAYHAGTTCSGSNLEGVRETVELAKNQKMLFLAHINAYCRGLVDDPIKEVSETIQLLKDNPHILSECHLAFLNATCAICRGGQVLDHVTLNCLNMKGYEPTQSGLEKAINEGYASVHFIENGEISFLSGNEGISYWKSQLTNTGVSFPVNRRDTAFLFACARKNSGELLLNNICTDGGGIPRNNLLQMGLSLVKFRGLSLKELISQISCKPAKTLGLSHKGNLRIGSDADITIFDYDKQIAVHSLVNGQFILLNKETIGKRGSIITTKHAKDYLEKLHVGYSVASPELLFE